MNNNVGYDDTLLEAEPECKPHDEPLEDKLDAALRDNEEQRRLLQIAAANGTLLAEKYFALEQEHEALTSKYMEVMQALDDAERERERHHNQRVTGSVQKCIDLEQKLDAQLREQEALDETRSHQEAEIALWRDKAASVMRDNAILKDMVVALERERDVAVQSRQHVTSTSRKVQQERDDLLVQVRDLTDRLNHASEKELRMALSHDIKLQKILRLENMVTELHEAVRAEVAKSGAMAEVAAQQEREAKELSGVINGLKQTLSALQEDYNMLVEKHNQMSTADATAASVPLTAWQHFLLVLTSFKDYLAHVAKQCTGYQHLQ